MIKRGFRHLVGYSDCWHLKCSAVCLHFRLCGGCELVALLFLDKTELSPWKWRKISGRIVFYIKRMKSQSEVELKTADLISASHCLLIFWSWDVPAHVIRQKCKQNCHLTFSLKSRVTDSLAQEKELVGFSINYIDQSEAWTYVTWQQIGQWQNGKLLNAYLVGNFA